MTIPDQARAIVVLAHGSASGPHGPANQFIASELEAHGLATLVVGLLTPDEQEQDKVEGSLRFDVSLLAARLESVIDWVCQAPGAAHLSMGLLGASTGAAAALKVAAVRSGAIVALVSLGGRPDLAGEALPRVTAPTLFLVGEMDLGVAGLNHAAARRLGGSSEVAIVSGATHLFSEPGALEEVADLAVWWFSRFLLGEKAALTMVAPESPRP